MQHFTDSSALNLKNLEKVEVEDIPSYVSFLTTIVFFIRVPSNGQFLPFQPITTLYALLRTVQERCVPSELTEAISASLTKFQATRSTLPVRSRSAILSFVNVFSRLQMQMMRSAEPIARKATAGEVGESSIPGQYMGITGK